MAKKDYSSWSKEQLVGRVRELEKRKKYGLVWDEEKNPENVVLQCKDKLPVLKEVKINEIKTDKSKPINILIEGDNYHALSVLNYTHKGKIDVIYIDPPYNRGGDFKYNDNYVEKDDSYRHSKWLSFMEKRLNLAKNLLKEEGVVFISVDENEFAQLSLLCQEIFGESQLDYMIWKKTGEGRDGKMKNTTTFRTDHEYILVCFKGEKKLNKIIELPNFVNEQKNSDNDPRGPWLSGSISRSDDASNPKSENYYCVTSPSGAKITRQFDISREDFFKLDKEGRISWGKDGKNVPRIKVFINEERAITPYSVLSTKGTTTQGTEETSSILKKDCSEMRPKPSLLIRTLIQLGLKKDTGIILDFFAGTGTTGHAVLENNKKYKINAKFILCTNNEESICSDYCYPKIDKIIEGYKNSDGEKIDGLGGNLKYFKTDFVDAEPTDKNKIKLTKEATEMLCLKEDTFESVLERGKFKIFKNGGRYTGIILDHRGIKEFKKAIKGIKGEFNIYVFSVGDDTFDEEFEDLEQKFKLSPIPEVILRVYRRIFNKL